jgi:guanine deaminase
MIQMKISKDDLLFLQMAVDLSREGMNKGEGGPFGCVIVKDGKVIGKGNNLVTTTNDPTAHAEVVAIRDACRQMGTFQLAGCTLYTSCEPCPMCLGAIYWARPERVIYANTKADAAAIGFDDAFIYREMAAPNNKRKIPFIAHPLADARKVFKEWQDKADKTPY